MLFLAMRKFHSQVGSATMGSLDLSRKSLKKTIGCDKIDELFGEFISRVRGCGDDWFLIIFFNGFDLGGFQFINLSLFDYSGLDDFHL